MSKHRKRICINLERNVLWKIKLLFCVYLTLFRIGLFPSCSPIGMGGGGQKYPSSIKSATHILHWWNLAVIPYLKNIQKYINHVTHSLSFPPKINNFCYIKKFRYRLIFMHNFCFLTFPESLKIFLANMVAILIKLVK